MQKIAWIVCCFLNFLSAIAQQKRSYVLYTSGVDCPKGASVLDIRIRLFMDGKEVSPTGVYLEQGTHNLRATVEPREGYSGNFIITRIEWFKCGAGVYGEPKNEESRFFNSKEASMPVTINNAADESPCYRAWVYVDKCGDDRPVTEAKVKVIATASRKVYKPEEPLPTDKISVVIGGQKVSFDKDGVGFIKVKPAKHLMKLDWEGGGNSAPGTVSIRSTKNNSESSLKQNPTRFAYIHEYNIDLQPGAGTNNLYDYEIRVNMIYEPTRSGKNEVRIVAVMPSVEVHKAGTPEDAWIPAHRDMVLQEGDEISCDPDGAATLQFADNSTTVVKNTTQLKIASYFTEGGVVKTEILLKMGEVAAQVHKSEATRSDFVIKAPGDEGSVRGTRFSYRYDASLKSSTIKVEEGSVEIKSLTNKYAPVLLRAGQQVKTFPASIGKPEPFSEKISFDLPGTQKITTTQNETGVDLTGEWRIIQGTYSGTLKLKQQGEEITGTISWDNHQKGVVEGGSVQLGSFILFTLVYEGDLKGYYNAQLEAGGLKMIEGKCLSNKGTESTWSAVKQKR